jgi:hypothetical protein
MTLRRCSSEPLRDLRSTLPGLRAVGRGDSVGRRRSRSQLSIHQPGAPQRSQQRGWAERGRIARGRRIARGTFSIPGEQVSATAFPERHRSRGGNCGRNGQAVECACHAERRCAGGTHEIPVLIEPAKDNGFRASGPGPDEAVGESITDSEALPNRRKAIGSRIRAGALTYLEVATDGASLEPAAGVFEPNDPPVQELQYNEATAKNSCPFRGRSRV